MELQIHGLTSKIWLFIFTVQFLGIMAQSSDFKSSGVVPDVIDKAPAEIATITYPNNIKVDFGQELTPTKVKDTPKVEWDNADNSGFYTLCMTDPDAPSRAKPTNREFKHWLVVNIPGKDISKGEVLSGYVGSGPPSGTGLHRYVFLVYKQTKKLTFDEKRVTSFSSDTRPKFSIKKFAEKYNLGDPIAGNMFQAQYDDYVPTIHKQLRGQKK